MEEELKAARYHMRHKVNIDEFKNRVYKSLDGHKQYKNLRPSFNKKLVIGLLTSLLILPTTAGLAYTAYMYYYNWNNVNVQVHYKEVTVGSNKNGTSLEDQFKVSQKDMTLTNGETVHRNLMTLDESRKSQNFQIRDAEKIDGWEQIGGTGILTPGVIINAFNKNRKSTFVYLSLFKKSNGQEMLVSQSLEDGLPSAAYLDGKVKFLKDFGDNFAFVIPKKDLSGKTYQDLTIWQKRSDGKMINVNMESYAGQNDVISFAHTFFNTPAK